MTVNSRADCTTSVANRLNETTTGILNRPHLRSVCKFLDFALSWVQCKELLFQPSLQVAIARIVMASGGGRGEGRGSSLYFMTRGLPLQFPQLFEDWAEEKAFCTGVTGERNPKICRHSSNVDYSEFPHDRSVGH